MSDFLPGYINKNDGGNPPATEYFLKKRSVHARDDDNVPWLITFADLMTILLVFSFFLFILNIKTDKNNAVPGDRSDRITSFVPLANATVKNQAAARSVSIYINDSEPDPDKKQDGERIIERKIIFFSEKNSALHEGFKTDLNKLAAIYRKNPSSKIILTIYSDITTSTSANRIMNIIGYLKDKCSVKPEKIFLQSVPDNSASPVLISQYKNIPKKRLVEVKVVKAFWSF